MLTHEDDVDVEIADDRDDANVDSDTDDRLLVLGVLGDIN